MEEIADGKEGDVKIAALAVDCVDASCGSDLEEDGDGDGLWSVLVKLLGAFVRDGEFLIVVWPR